MSLTPYPTEVRFLADEQRLKVVFNDGLEVAYPTPYLRGYCPCAHCQGHSGGPPKWNAIRNARQIEVDNVTPVGNYALCIQWGDGHDTGIYAFVKLRELAAQIEEGLPKEETYVQFDGTRD